MKFSYQARTKRGEIQSGIVEASSEEAVLALLQRHGLVVTVLERVGREPFYLRKIRFFERISRKEVVAFSRQLSIMFRSNIPPLEAFYALAKQTKNPNFKEKILEMAEEISGGSPLSKTLSAYPQLFSPFFLSMIKSGEASGTLSEAIEYLANHLERDESFRSQLKGAMIYPLFVLFIFFIILAAMLFFVIPSLTVVLKETGGELPLISKIVISLSDFFRAWGWLLMIVFLAGVLFLYRLAKTPKGKPVLDQVSLQVPFLGHLLEKVYLARFAENLSTLISGGLPIARALEITGEVVGNEVYKTIIFQARDEVKKGEAISQVLERYPKAIPPFFIQMVSVGEKTGTLGQSLLNVVGLYQKEVDRALTTFLRLLEPILIVFLGLIIAILMAAVVLPLYQIGFQ